MLPRQAVDNWSRDRCSEWIGHSHAQLADGWVGEKLDFLHRLVQLIEHSVAAAYERRSITRYLDATRTALKQSDAEQVLHVGNSLGPRGLRHRQVTRRFRHAAALHDC